MIPEKGEMFNHWGLDRKTVFLNHGSFGATPFRLWKNRTGLEE